MDSSKPKFPATQDGKQAVVLRCLQNRPMCAAWKYRQATGQPGDILACYAHILRYKCGTMITVHNKSWQRVLASALLCFALFAASVTCVGQCDGFVDKPCPNEQAGEQLEPETQDAGAIEPDLHRCPNCSVQAAVPSATPDAMPQPPLKPRATAIAFGIGSPVQNLFRPPRA